MEEDVGRDEVRLVAACGAAATRSDAVSGADASGAALAPAGRAADVDTAGVRPWDGCAAVIARDRRSEAAAFGEVVVDETLMRVPPKQVVSCTTVGERLPGHGTGGRHAAMTRLYDGAGPRY